MYVYVVLASAVVLCLCVCEELSKNTGNGALCRMSFGSQPQRKELSGGGSSIDGGICGGAGGGSSRLSCFCLLASIGANMLSQASFNSMWAGCCM